MATTKSKLRASAFDQRLYDANNAKAIDIMNERHFTVKSGAKYVVGDERPGELITLFPYEKFRHRYLWHQRNEGDRTVDLAALWLESPVHRHYDGRIVFKPGVESPDDYNLWKGFAVTPKRGDWSLFPAHLLDNVCRGEKAWFGYLLNYFAQMVQQPGRLPGVAIVLRGGEGVGKTCIFDYLAAMFLPEHSLLVADTRGLTGNFNYHLANKVLVCADEAFFAGDRSVVGTLQSLITSRRVTVEPKFVDRFDVDNCMHLIIASNSKQVVQAAQQARRYFALDVGDDHQKDFQYFDAITKQMAQGGTAAMLYDLQRRDISTFNPMDFPDTPALNEQKELSLPPHAEWLKEKLQTATPETWNPIVEKIRLFQDYQEWMQAFGHAGRYPLPMSGLTIYLQELFGLGIHFRPHGGRRTYRFPDLRECRQIFDRFHTLQTTWEPGVVKVRLRRRKRL